MKFIPLIGRILFSLLFLMAIMGHFSSGTIAYAVSAGVPMASIMVPLSGIIAFIGGLSIVLGFKTKMGAWLIIIFLIPVTFMMHKFWTVSDPMAQQMQMANFMKNMGLIGGALFLTYFGAGPISIDNRAA
jgi:putative oxidoreductase